MRSRTLTSAIAMNLAAVQLESQHLTSFFSAPVVNVPATGAAGDSDNSDYHHEPGASEESGDEPGHLEASPMRRNRNKRAYASVEYRELSTSDDADDLVTPPITPTFASQPLPSSSPLSPSPSPPQPPPSPFYFILLAQIPKSRIVSLCYRLML